MSDELLSILSRSTYFDKYGNLEPLSIVDANSCSYSQFFENYIIRNRLCLITSKNLISDWKASQKWISEDTPEAVNWEYLSKMFGELEVSVVICGNTVDTYNYPSCEKMILDDYISYLRKYQKSGYSKDMPCLYLKDWHLFRKTSDKFYEVPHFFTSDWLNEGCCQGRDDFKFVYIGPKGSWTPFHADVYGSFSWSANIIGKKKWWIYPPGIEQRFLNINGKIIFDPGNPGKINLDYYEIIQDKGTVIFVPSGWYHIVWNLEDTISINENWMNGANIGYIWHKLKAALVDVRKELEDLKNYPEFPQICQDLLNANHGMNFSTFAQIISVVANNRKRSAESDSCQLTVGGQKQIEYDLEVLRSLVKNFKEDPDISILCSLDPKCDLAICVNKLSTDLRKDYHNK